MNSSQKEELRKSIQEKIEEITLANFDGNVDGLLIISIHNGNFILRPAYASQHASLVNVALDLAKDNLMQAVKNAAMDIDKRGMN